MLTITSIRTTGELGPLLKRLRKEKRWTQAQLGHELGLSQERISAIENHPEKVTFDTLLTVMMALGAEFLVSPDKTGIASLARHGQPPKENW